MVDIFRLSHGEYAHDGAERFIHRDTFALAKRLAHTSMDPNTFPGIELVTASADEEDGFHYFTLILAQKCRQTPKWHTRRYVDQLFIECVLLFSWHAAFKPQGPDAHKFIVLGSMVQFKLTSLLNHVNKEQRLHVLLFGKEFGNREKMWRENVVGAWSAARVAAGFNRLRGCQVFFSTSYEDTRLGIDLFVITDDQIHLAISVKTGGVTGPMIARTVEEQNEHLDEPFRFGARQVYNGTKRLNHQYQQPPHEQFIPAIIIVRRRLLESFQVYDSDLDTLNNLLNEAYHLLQAA